MGSKIVRLDEDVYERIEGQRRRGESLSDAIDRLTGDYSLLDFAGGHSDEGAEQHRSLLERSEETVTEDRRELLDRMGVDAERSSTVHPPGSGEHRSNRNPFRETGDTRRRGDVAKPGMATDSRGHAPGDETPD